MSEGPAQLVLELPHRPAMGVEDFLVSGSNAAAVSLIDRWPDWPTGSAILCGPAGSGKTHLVNVWRTRSNAHVISSDTLSVDNVPDLPPERALAIEDISKRHDEQAMFHVLNTGREHGIALLLTTDRPPGELAIKLPDLASRLKALPLALIAPPDDALLRAVLVKLFADRQLAVEPHVLDYVLIRMERSMAAAQAFVAEVDRCALAMQRAVSRSVAAQALSRLGAA